MLSAKTRKAGGHHGISLCSIFAQCEAGLGEQIQGDLGHMRELGVDGPYVDQMGAFSNSTFTAIERRQERKR
jgi:hypothetical protein